MVRIGAKRDVIEDHQHLGDTRYDQYDILLVDSYFVLHIVLVLIYRSYAYELEYSSCDMILAYELVYSFHVLIMSYRTLCLILHTYMFRPRIRVLL